MASKIQPYFFSDAIREFWQTRNRQATEQVERGNKDQGSRSAVTGGKQMDGFVRKITRLLIDAGIEPGDIYTNKGSAVLPGFFRPTKEWDFVVVQDKALTIAIEFKSQVGPSFGNNFNNRTEEALGSALDIWTAYREGAFRPSPSPWLGYFLVLEDCPRSQSKVRVDEPHFSVFEEFRGASYAKRYELFCLKLVRERKYNAACFIAADKNKANEKENYSEPLEELSVNNFLSELLRHVSAQ